jgi:hypothetical protein
VQYFGSLNYTSGPDSDDDGLTDFQEFNKGSDPTQQDADGDLLTDFVDPYPNDYYNAVAPTLSLLSGGDQTAAPGTFNAHPFDVAVWDAGATSPLINAPVTFTVTSGGGTLVKLLTDIPANEISLATDEIGTVQAYFKQLSSPGIASIVTVTAGTAQLQIHTASGDLIRDYDLDYDGDGIPNGWEVEHGLNPYDSADAAQVVGGLTNLQIYQQSLTVGGDPASANALGLLVYTP